MATRKRKGRGQAARRVEPVAIRSHLRRWLPLPLAVIVLSLVLFGLAHANVKLPEPEFPIVTLQVESTFKQVDAGRIAEIVAPMVTGGFFETDVGAVKQALVDLPWIRDAGVRRVWPDALHITLLEQQAVAQWGDEGLLNPDGELFRPPLEEWRSDLPLLDGPARTQQQVTRHYREFDAHLAPLGLAITQIAMDPRRAWKLTLDNGVTLVLGRKDTERQVQRFARFWPQVMAERASEIEEVDLRYPNGFAVKWNETGDRV